MLLGLVVCILVHYTLLTCVTFRLLVADAGGEKTLLMTRCKAGTQANTSCHCHYLGPACIAESPLTLGLSSTPALKTQYLTAQMVTRIPCLAHNIGHFHLQCSRHCHPTCSLTGTMLPLQLET